MVGDGTITFSGREQRQLLLQVTAGEATNVQQSKAITRYEPWPGPQPTCTYATTPNSPPQQTIRICGGRHGAEDGWGVNFAHQGDLLFATWYTYDANARAAIAAVALGADDAAAGMCNVFTGPLTRMSGPRFDNYDTSEVTADSVGTATVDLRRWQQCDIRVRGDGCAVSRTGHAVQADHPIPVRCNGRNAPAISTFRRGPRGASQYARRSLSTQSPIAHSTARAAGGRSVMRRSLSRARERRDITVPIGIPSTTAISS